MGLLVVCTVGGSTGGVITSLERAPRPQRVIFVCSEDSQSSLTTDRGRDRAILQGLRDLGAELVQDQYVVVVISDPQDYQGCVREIEREVGSAVWAWKQEGGEVAIDPTGGTKCMSVALALVARRWNCQFRYVGGKRREKEGLGVVEGGSEDLLVCQNPLDVLGYQVAEEAIGLAGQHDYEAAFQILKARLPAKSTTEVEKNLWALRDLMQMFSAWERFDHGAAANLTKQLAKKEARLRECLDEVSVREVIGQLGEWRRRLEMQTQERKASRELVEDLLGNAERRMKQGRYDDAVARMYRTIEAVAQWRLAERHGLASTERVPYDRLPEEMRDKKNPRAKDNTVSVALQDGYRLLQLWSDPVGRAFSDLGLQRRDGSEKEGKPKGSPLELRNQSILAHGFQSIGENGCRSLWETTVKLAEAAGIKEGTWVRFPALRWRGVV